MTDLLVSILITVCPVPEDGGTNKCHEDLINCAVQEGGKIDETTIRECLDKRDKNEDSSDWR